MAAVIDGGDDGADGVPFARSYDQFKHMTGVALVSLGGVFAFAGGGDMRFERRQLVVVLIFIGISGLVSLFMAGSLAALEIKPEPHATVVRRIRVASAIVGVSLSIGIGAFIYNFIPAIAK